MSRSTALLLLTLGTTASGCVTLDTALRHPPNGGGSAGAAQQVHAAWENRIVITQDTVNSGKPLVGLAGRVYLMEEFGKCVKGSGSVAIELHDATHANAQAAPKLIERFEIDKETIKRLLQKDDIGWGYTVFLPWSTYRPDIQRVQLQVKWQPDGGQPIYSPPAVVVLHGERQHQITSSQRRVTGAELANSGVLGPPPPAPPSATRP